VALDRFGPKMCMLVSIGFTVLGCVLFASSHDAASLVVARAVLGFGTASFLMAPVALYARWFPPERFSTFAGIQLGVGSCGAIFATAPMAFATANVGWRMTFLGVGVCAAVIGLLIWLIVTDDPPGMKREPHRETLRESLAGIWQVIRTPSMGRVFMVQLSSYPSYALIVGLWGGPYLTHVYGYHVRHRHLFYLPGAVGRLWPAAGAVAACRVRADRVLDRYDLGGDVAWPIAGAALSVGPDHHPPEHWNNGRWVPGAVRQRNPDQPISDRGRGLSAGGLPFGFCTAGMFGFHGFPGLSDQPGKPYRPVNLGISGVINSSVIRRLAPLAFCASREHICAARHWAHA
jgi:MFS family permease